jgi:hypothetical protein
MNKRNYNSLFENQIKSLEGKRAKLLLHACCAPCSSACLERLKDYFDVTVFFYNPNIEDEEYVKRKNEIIRFVKETGWAEICDCDHDTSEFYNVAKGLEQEPEGGKRCVACFNLRLERTANLASKNGFDYFTTTLTISPLKDADIINSLGEALAKKYNISWLYSDFKKKNGYLRSLQLSKEHDLYRQNFCGCIYSQKPLEK